MTDTLTPVLTDNWDQERSWTLAAYEERGGYAGLDKAFAMDPDDVIAAVKAATRMPTAAYSVGGEYAMIKAAAATGHLDERLAALESLTAIRRAGADIIITYHALDAARWLRHDPR